MNATTQHRDPDIPLHARHVTTATLGDRVPLYSNSPRQWIAASGMILRTEVGSTVHGTAVQGTDDLDEMGICLEPPFTVLGGQRFEGYQYRTARPDPDRPGQSPPSGPGDLDLTVYSARKFCRLAAQGNATVLLPLWVPPDAVRHITLAGERLRGIRDAFISKRAAKAFIGYLGSQRAGLLGERSNGSRNQGRRELRERYGYDVKFAMHMIRVGMQGVALLRDRHLPVPCEGGDLDYLRSVRAGQVPLSDVLARGEELRQHIRRLEDTPGVPADPDYQRIDQWLINSHREHWEATAGWRPTLPATIERAR